MNQNKTKGPTGPLQTSADSWVITPGYVEHVGTDTVTLDAIHVDGLLVTGTPLGRSFKLPLPAVCRDGDEHEVRVTFRRDDVPTVQVAKVQSRYVGLVERVGSDVLGWIYDAAAPHEPVHLDLLVDGTVAGAVIANLDRSDVAASGHPAARPGFQIAIPPNSSLTAPRIVCLRVAGTCTSPFPEYLVDVSAASYSDRSVDHTPGGQLLRNKVMRSAVLDAVRRGPGSGVPMPTGAVRLKGPARSLDGPVVKVVIPVYLGLEETAECIESALRGQGEIPYEVIVINDASPDQALSNRLRQWAEYGTFTYLENSVNTGFVRTVNRGMEVDPVADVVLLNSDTVVPAGWLDRLYAAAYSGDDIGTVTALSNNATICSLPDIGGSAELPYERSLEELDELCRKANPGLLVDLPTAHGFCMFIRRAVLDEIGLFDAEKFGRGYGEENDFSLRAATRGWRNVAACDVFVQHRGSVSFKGDASVLTQKNLAVIHATFPDYSRQVMQFLRDDPMHVPRNNVVKALWRKKKKPILFVSLAIGGGVDKHVEDLARTLVGKGERILLVTRFAGEGNYAHQIREWGSTERLLYPHGSAAFRNLLGDLLAFEARYAHVHHVIDLEDGLADLFASAGIPYQVTLHDFFYLCPRVTLLDESSVHCGLPSADKCTRCIARSGSHPAVHASLQPLVLNVGRWRKRWSGFLRTAERLIAPSESTRTLYEKVWPGLAIDVLPHEGVEPPVAKFQAEPRPARVGVVVLGAIGPHKGIHHLLQLLRFTERWADYIDFTVVGFTSKDPEIRQFANVRVTGPYEEEDVSQLIRGANAQVALFLSPWPETYSYTWSEAVREGLVPVAFDMGAIAERTRLLGCGELVPPEASPQAIVDAIVRAAGMRIKPGTLTQGKWPLPMLDGVTARPKVRSRRDLLLLGEPRGLFDDNWSSIGHTWLVHSESMVSQIECRIWVPEWMPGQVVSVQVNGREVGSRLLNKKAVNHVKLPCSITPGCMEVSIRFRFDRRLSQQDARRCAAVLNDFVLLNVSDGGTWSAMEALKALRLRRQPQVLPTDVVVVDEPTVA